MILSIVMKYLELNKITTLTKKTYIVIYFLCVLPGKYYL